MHVIIDLDHDSQNTLKLMMLFDQP